MVVQSASGKHRIAVRHHLWAPLKIFKTLLFTEIVTDFSISDVWRVSIARFREMRDSKGASAAEARSLNCCHAARRKRSFALHFINLRSRSQFIAVVAQRFVDREILYAENMGPKPEQRPVNGSNSPPLMHGWHKITFATSISTSCPLFSTTDDRQSLLIGQIRFNRIVFVDGAEGSYRCGTDPAVARIS